MIIKKINHFCGYAFFAVGALRMVLVILALLYTISVLSNINSSAYEFISSFSSVLAIIQVIVTLLTIPMIFLNKKDQPDISKAYLYALGVIILENILPSFLAVFFIYVTSSMYMKAGSKIINEVRNDEKIQNNFEKTEWFYNQANRDSMSQEEGNVLSDIKKEKKNEKIVEEIFEWKKLLDSGEIDEETYNDIKDKLLKKMKK